MTNRTFIAVLLVSSIFIAFQSASGAVNELGTGEKFLMERDYENAATWFLSFAQQQPQARQAPFALYTAARIRMIVQEKPQEAQTLFDRLIRDYVESEWAFHGAIKMADFNDSANDSIRKADYLQKAVEIGEQIHPAPKATDDAQFRVLQNCGAAYLRLNNYEQAQKYYARLVATNIFDLRQMPEIHSNFALCMEKLGYPDVASEHYFELLQTYPNSRQAMGLLSRREKVDSYYPYNWDAYQYFVDGYQVFRTQPIVAADRFTKLAAKGADSDLVRVGQKLLIWVYYYGNDYKKASEAHIAYQSRYPDDADIYVRLFPMYVDAYKQDFEFKKYLTRFSVLRLQADTSQILFESAEYAMLTSRDDWVEIDLEPNCGVYNHALYVARPLDKSDRAYLRFYVKSPQSAEAYLEIDTDESGRVWQNGVFHGMYESESKEKLAVNLKEGLNEFVIQLTQSKGEMKTTIRLLNAASKVDENLVYTAAKE
ncbi:hypothetical protein JXJ21_13520 [candidate division KSB1 bacterium]|nr:hypothetical protein [candidate division KSB1 bacterium]